MARKVILICAQNLHFRRATQTRPSQDTSAEERERETEVAYSTSYVIIGAHVETSNAFIDRVVFGLTGLEEWCNATGFSGEVKRPQVRSRSPKGKLAEVLVKISFRSSSTRFFNIGRGRRLRFLSLYRGPDYFDREKQFELKGGRNKIEIVFSNRLPIEQALDEIRIWQTFISFGFGSPVFWTTSLF